MFHYDGGLKLTSIDLAIDFRRRQPRGFVSHAHTDHMGRHELAFCTPVTARLYHHRLGKRPVHEMPFHETLDWNSLHLTTLPAGHVYGSAMLLVEDGSRRLLYTGDFKLGESATAERAVLPAADVLVMESTFGDPRYRLPPRDEVVAELVNLCRTTIAAGGAPVIHAYALGKSQEVTRILTDNGIPVQQHPLAFQISQIYESLGCSLGSVSLYEGVWNPGAALVMPPRGQRSSWMPLPIRRTHIAVTGWAIDPASRFRYRVDHALPLSDHADYDELLECVERVQPREIYCTHGPTSFVERLRARGHNAHPLDERAGRVSPVTPPRLLFN